MAKTMRGFTSEQKRATIVDAARTLFTTQGFEATSMAEVAARANVAPNTIYWYFANKDALLLATLDQLVMQAQAQYLEMAAQPFAAKVDWLIEQFTQLGNLVGVVHGRVAVSDSVRVWHDHFHLQTTAFFVQRLRDRGASASHAEAVVSIAFFLMEGLATHTATRASRDMVIQLLEQAVTSAMLGANRPRAPRARRA